MKSRFVILLFCVLTCCLISTESAGEQNSQFTTSFITAYSVNGSKFQADMPTASGKRWVLPADFSHWNCLVTNKFLNDDGKSVYHNIVCSDVDSSVAVGVSIECSLQSEMTNYKSFFLRKGSVSVEVDTLCQTKRISTGKTSGTNL